MKSVSIALYIPMFLLLLSCQNEVPAGLSIQEQTLKTDAIEPIQVKYQEITKDWMTWYTYTYYQVRLAQDFIGYDQDSASVDKSTFLKKLATGKFIAFKVAKVNNVPVYKLLQPKEVKEDIRSTTIQMAQIALTLMQTEGKELPAFQFTDVNGRTYDKSNTKGKLLVIKCWFIHCVACVKEFPALNSLVEKYSSRQDIRFVSLALDTKQDLVAFLSKNNFRYAVVPGAKDYITNQLAVTSYPTHLLVDRNGMIRKVTDSIDDLIPSLEKEISQPIPGLLQTSIPPLRSRVSDTKHQI